MAFQTKTFLAIVASMVNRMRATSLDITDYNVGGVARTMVEAPAVEMDALYEEVRAGLKEGIPTAVFTSFNWERQAARSAIGTIRIVVTAAAAARTITLASLFTQQGGAALAFRSTAVATIPAGETQVDVPARAVAAGVRGNIASGTTFAMETPPDGFVSAIALGAFGTGRDQETLEARKLRFHAYLKSLGRCSEESIDYGLREKTMLLDSAGVPIERVASVKIIRPWEVDPNNPPGQLTVYIHNGVDGASAGLIAEGQKILRGYTDSTGQKVMGYKAGGVPVTLLASAVTSVAVTGTVTAATGLDDDAVEAVLQAVRDALAAIIVALEIGAPCYRAALITAAMEVPGVVNFTLAAPSADITPAGTTKLMPGTLTIAAA